MRYDVPGSGSAEIDGVCKLTEDSVSCWNVSGARYEDLENRVREGLNSRQGSSPIQFAFGKKNRLIVVKITRQMNSRIGLNIDSLAGVDSFSSVQLPNQNQFYADRPSVNFDARMQSVDPDDKTTRIRLGISEPSHDRPTLALKPGATATIDGNTVKILSIHSGGPQTPYSYMPMTQHVMWTADVLVVHSKGRPMMLGFAMVDPKSGSVMVDKAGNPVSMDVVRKESERRMQEVMKSRGRYVPYVEKYQQASAWLVAEAPGGKAQLVLTANPAKIGSLSLTGTYRRTVDIEGIPLDPK